MKTFMEQYGLKLGAIKEHNEKGLKVVASLLGALAMLRTRIRMQAG